MYYLQSRYYVPAWGRFLNADGYVNANGDLIGFNMYAYCSNNPVMYTDESGQSLIVTMLIGAGISIAIDLAFQLIENDWNINDDIYTVMHHLYFKTSHLLSTPASTALIRC